MDSVLSPLQGLFFPYNSDQPIIPDFRALFGNPHREETARAPRVALREPRAWSGVTPNGEFASLIYYRVNRLNEIMNDPSKSYDALLPGATYMLQLYIDSHLPAAAVLVGLASEEAVDVPIPRCETMSEFSCEVTKAILYTQKASEQKRHARRAASLWEVIKWTLPMELRLSVSEHKPRTFKTLSTEFTDVFRAEGHPLHDVVLCSLLGNYPDAVSRPNWTTRLNVFANHCAAVQERGHGWYKKCDYITYYAMREMITHVLPMNTSLIAAIERVDHARAAWEVYASETRAVTARLRTMLNDYAFTSSLIEVHDTLKNKHNRMAKSLTVDASASPKVPLSWASPHSAALLVEMIQRGVAVNQQVSQVIRSHLRRRVSVADVRADVAKAAHVQRALRVYKMPGLYCQQLRSSLREGQNRALNGQGSVLKETPCSSAEDAQRRCTLYVCSTCHKIMNNINNKTTQKEYRLRYRNVIRIEIDDDGEVMRFCNDCTEKRGQPLVPLVEIPLLEPVANRAYSCVIFDSAVTICPRCTLFTERSLLRFGVDGSETDWGCWICTEVG